MKDAMIDGKEIKYADIFSPVTYVPPHAEGNNGHKDCVPCVLINIVDSDMVTVLNCHTRTKQRVSTDLLIWG